MNLWLCPSAFAPHRGGVEELTLKLAQHLAQRGHEVLVVTNRHPANLAAIDEIEGIAVRRLTYSLPTRSPTGLIWHLRSAGALQRELERLPRPDLIHLICLSSQTGPLNSFARDRNIPLILTTQGETAMDAQGIYQRNPWLRYDVRRAAREASALTACSAWTRDHAAGIAPEFAESEVVFNGVDVADWAVPPPPTEPVFAAWGRHVREKGFDLLVDAFSKVRAQLPGALLLLGGDGPQRQALPVARGVELLGPLDRRGVRNMLVRARVVVVPSRIEPFGIVAVEALAAGRGLVYSSHGGLAEAAGSCGRVADPTDPLALATAMLNEFVDPTPKSMGLRRANELSWNKITDQYEGIYRLARS